MNKEETLRADLMKFYKDEARRYQLKRFWEKARTWLLIIGWVLVGVLLFKGLIK